MVKGRMFSGKMDASFGLDDLIVQQSLLTRVEKSEGAACVGIIMPHMGSAGLEFLPNLRMDHRDVFNGLLDALVRQK